MKYLYTFNAVQTYLVVGAIIKSNFDQQIIHIEETTGKNSKNLTKGALLNVGNF